MQLGFVIDHSRCIGCHACTVACKSENEVPLGSFRTWVKYTEQGAFPKVKRSFAVLRCNQCTAAPCVSICPTVALSKRPDGIVDIDPDRCVGCKSCMQACPYDALYINEELGTAQKCHFCAHRTERGLAPACAVVCPTEAIIPGDFHDPQSRVSRMRAGGDLDVRKAEAGTGPNVYYRDVAPACIDPQQTSSAGGYLWANQVPSMQLDSEQWEAIIAKAKQEPTTKARTVYDVQNPPLWGWKVSAYLFTKSIAAGTFLVLTLLSILADEAARPLPQGLPTFTLISGLFFLGVTLALLLLDLKRPERFLYILLKPNWGSWLVRGAVILGVYGAVLTLFALGNLGWLPALPAMAVRVLTGIGVVAAALTAMYTAWLFAQAKGRPLWRKRGLSLHLLVQAWTAGCCLALLAWPFTRPWAEWVEFALRTSLAAGLIAHVAFVVLEHKLAPAGREKEFHRAGRLLTQGPFAKRRMMVTLAIGILAPLCGLAMTRHPVTLGVIAVMVLIGLWNEEDLFVKAGQALPIH